MNAQAAENRSYVRTKLQAAGLLPGLTALAEDIRNGAERRPGRWSYHWAKAYSYGHNIVNLRNGRLAHFANAFADIAEEVDVIAPDLEMTLEAFYLRWNAGDLFEGGATEHWYLA